MRTLIAKLYPAMACAFFTAFQVTLLSGSANHFLTHIDSKQESLLAREDDFTWIFITFTLFFSLFLIPATYSSMRTLKRKADGEDPSTKAGTLAAATALTSSFYKATIQGSSAFAFADTQLKSFLSTRNAMITAATLTGAFSIGEVISLNAFYSERLKFSLSKLIITGLEKIIGKELSNWMVASFNLAASAGYTIFSTALYFNTIMDILQRLGFTDERLTEQHDTWWEMGLLTIFSMASMMLYYTNQYAYYYKLAKSGENTITEQPLEYDRREYEAIGGSPVKAPKDLKQQSILRHVLTWFDQNMDAIFSNPKIQKALKNTYYLCRDPAVLLRSVCQSSQFIGSLLEVTALILKSCDIDFDLAAKSTIKTLSICLSTTLLTAIVFAPNRWIYAPYPPSDDQAADTSSFAMIKKCSGKFVEFLCCISSKERETRLESSHSQKERPLEL